MSADQPALDEHIQARRIDALVAEKVFGQHVFRRWPDADYDSWMMYPLAEGTVPSWDQVDLPPYTTSWDAAGQVVNSWEGDVRIGRQNGAWWVEFCRPSEEFKEWADTFPLAVCRAALKARGVDVGNA